MRRSTVLMVVCVAVVLAATADVGWCLAGEESYIESVTNKANEAQQRAKESIRDVKDNADSWAGWFLGKVSSGLGLGEKHAKETAHNVIDKAEEAATKSTESIQSAASGTSKYASQKATSAMHKASDLAGNAKETISETMRHGCGGASDNNAYYLASDMADNVRDRANDAYNYASAKGGEAHEWGSDGVERVVGGIYGGGHWANEVYDSVGDTYESMKEKAREKYKAAKERVSDADGKVGEKMRNKAAEL